jgi:arginase
LAVKIVRQPKKIALIGAPTSAAALVGGHERAPAALRAAGLVERLQSLGYEVTDLGDCAVQTFQPDDEHPRARNVRGVLAALNDLKPRVEQAVKSGALPLILGGDCSIALATIAGARRYYRNVSLVYVDRDADLNIPATTSSGCVDGMVVSHVVGRGAPELVRFWGEPPLVREPDVTLFGFERLDAPEQEFLTRSPIRRYRADDISRQGVAAAAQAALERVHAAAHEFVLHFDVDTISSEDFRATNYPGSGGLRLDQVREALTVFARQSTLAAFEITVYNPELDADGSGAKTILELIAAVFGERFAVLAGAEAAAPTAAPAAEAPVPEQADAQPTPPAESAVLESSQPAEPPATVAEQAPPEPLPEPAETSAAEVPATPEPESSGS